MNEQKPMPKNWDQAGLHVNSVFETIQGEGPHAGRPATFVRMAHCNLQCPLCDTDYKSTWHCKEQDLFAQLRAMNSRLVVFTGGEPLRQRLDYVIQPLIGDSREVAIETNGTLWEPMLPYGHPGFTVVCSPKTPTVNRNLIRHVNAWKYVLDAGFVSPDDGLPLTTLGNQCGVARPPANFPRHRIYVQPLDEKDDDKNRRHTMAAVASCKIYGYTLSLQLQKILGLP